MRVERQVLVPLRRLTTSGPFVVDQTFAEGHVGAEDIFRYIHNRGFLAEFPEHWVQVIQEGNAPKPRVFGRVLVFKIKGTV